MSVNFKVKLLEEGAKAPVCTRPGSDLAYDIFSLEDYALYGSDMIPMVVRTGIAVSCTIGHEGDEEELGFIIKDRSSMAAKGVFTHGGVIDGGYRGEIKVLMSSKHGRYAIKAGDKIAQLVPVYPLTGGVEVVDSLPESDRGDKGFGSSGR